MELFIFIVFQLLTEVRSYKSPTVNVSPDVIRESSSVKISCETPADVRVSQCYFYTNREQKNIKVRSSCELELTGAEVLRWAGVKSPESIYINCYYTINERGINKPSSDSPPAIVTVLDSIPKPIISVSGDDVQLSISCEIPLSVRANFICSLYTEDDVLLYHRVSHWSQSGKNLCMFYSSRSELFTRSVNSRQLICVYSLKTEPEIRSPRSDTYTIRVSTPTTTKHTTTTTAQKTSRTVMSTSETTTYSKTIWFIVLVSTGVAVILSGLTGFLCRCWFASKKRRKQSKKLNEPSQETGTSCSGPAETYSLITFVPATSQPIGLEHPESHQDSTAVLTDTRSFITSVNPIHQPSDGLVNKKRKWRNTEENVNVNHLYSTIPDKPVHSNTGDQVYSLVKMH